LRSGIKDAQNPRSVIADPEIMNAFDTPIESAINPVCNNPENRM